jgi:sugar phosphate isomerase/epimerase
MTRAALSWSTVTFPPGDLDAALEWAAWMQVPVELGPAHAREAARHRAAQTGWRPPPDVRLASLHAWCDVDGLAEVCPAAEGLRAPLIVVHGRHEALVRDFAGAVEHVRCWTQWCAERGIVLSVENSSRQPLRPFLDLFEAVPDLRFTLDVKHAYKPETLGLTYVDYLRPLGERIVNFHVSGVDRARDELGDGVPPGRDHIDWSALSADLAARQYGGLITVELNLPDLPAADLAAAYADLPTPPGVAAPSVSQRLAWYGVQFFSREFSPVLDGVSSPP